MTCFFATLKPGFHWRRKHERKHNNSYFTMKTALDRGESANTRIKIFPFSCTCAYACICGATIENETPLRHNTSTRIFTTRGYVWSMKTLEPDYFALKRISAPIDSCRISFQPTKDRSFVTTLIETFRSKL